jgi:hypothetical protein
MVIVSYFKVSYLVAWIRYVILIQLWYNAAVKYVCGPINVSGAGRAIENSFIKILFHQSQDIHRRALNCQTC